MSESDERKLEDGFAREDEPDVEGHLHSEFELVDDATDKGLVDDATEKGLVDDAT